MQADSVLGYLKSGNNSGFDTIEEDFLKASLEFYKPEKSAGKSLQIGKNSKFVIPLDNFNSKNLLTEFWLKLNEPNTQILKITNVNNSEPVFNISTNSFQILTVNSNLSQQED
ncbi:MAG: hypothetical protein P8017_12240, partial [Deltaproteobacteria bacterium]